MVAASFAKAAGTASTTILRTIKRPPFRGIVKSTSSSPARFVKILVLPDLIVSAHKPCLPPMPIVALSNMRPGQEADMFVLMTAKEQLNTRDGKPYFRVGFRDSGREVAFPIWDNSPWAAECRDKWTPGAFYKVRASTAIRTTARNWTSARFAKSATPTRPTASIQRAASRNRVTSRP